MGGIVAAGPRPLTCVAPGTGEGESGAERGETDRHERSGVFAVGSEAGHHLHGGQRGERVLLGGEEGLPRRGVPDLESVAGADDDDVAFEPVRW